MLPLQIELYETKNIKVADTEFKSTMKFEFGTNDFSPYDLSIIYKDHCARIYYNWLSGVF